MRGSPGSRVSGIGDVDVARVLDLVAELAHALVDLRHPEGRRAHVHAAAARAEVEGHADERHLALAVMHGQALARASRRRETLTGTSDSSERASLESGSRCRWLAPRRTRKPSAPPAPAPAEPSVRRDPAPRVAQGAHRRAGRARAPRRAHEQRHARSRRSSRLGFANEVQIAQALAAHAGLPYVKINPLDLDLDVVTKGISGPFARKHGLVAISKTADKITVAVYDPFAPFPYEDVKRVTGLDVERVVATRSGRGDDQQGLLRPQDQPADRGEAAHLQPLCTVDLGNQEFLSATPRSSTRRRRPWSRPSTTS